MVYNNPNTFTEVVGKVQKKLLPEGGREGGEKEQGPGLEPGTYHMLGEVPLPTGCMELI